MTEIEPVGPKPVILSEESRARFQAALAECGRQFREHVQAVLGDLKEALRPTLDALVALHHAFEAAGMYELDPAEVRVRLLEDDADDYAEVYRDTPVLVFPEERAVCAHVCGTDPDHECTALAAGMLKYENLAGGVTRMPVCAACRGAEAASVGAVGA